MSLLHEIGELMRSSDPWFGGFVLYALSWVVAVPVAIIWTWLESLK